jgi:hypothetical protein
MRTATVGIQKARDADRQLKCETVYMLGQLDKYIARNYGPRCEEHEAGCPVCEMWARYDSIKNYTA